MVRFGDQKGGSDKDLAILFGTTMGKINDIKRKSTFEYITEGFKPTEAMKDEGIAWLKRHIGYVDGKVDVLINELEAMPVATVAEAADFEAIRAKARGQKPTTKTGEVADAGGGNRVKPPKAAAAPAKKVDASDLM